MTRRTDEPKRSLSSILATASLAVLRALDRDLGFLGPQPVDRRPDKLEAEERVATLHQPELMAEIERLRQEIRDLRTALADKPAG